MIGWPIWGLLELQADHVFVRDDVQGQAAVALAADEVALEERAVRDEPPGVGDPAEQGDTPLDRGEAGVAAAGGDLAGRSISSACSRQGRTVITTWPPGRR